MRNVLSEVDDLSEKIKRFELAIIKEDNQWQLQDNIWRSMSIDIYQLLLPTINFYFRKGHKREDYVSFTCTREYF